MSPGQVEGETVDCGYLVVPEQRADPSSRSIRLALAIFHPPGGAIRPDPVVYLEGGPGGSPLKLLALPDRFHALYAPLLAEGRELILIDQRGVGRSEPALECPGVVELYLDLLDQRLDGDRLDGAAMRRLKVEALTSCAETLGTTADLTAYNSAASAADIEDLRVALGYEQLDLWGTSYGTWLALAVMRDHPEGVRSVVLDAPAPPQIDLYVDTPGSFARSLDEVFTTCADDDACDDAYPDLEAVFLETIEQLDAEPVPVMLLDQIAGERVPLLMDGDVFIEQVFRGLYSAAMRQALPGVIYDAHEGTFDTLLLGQQDVLRQYFRSWGMYFSVLCHDEVPFSSADAFEVARARHPELAGMYDHFEIGPLAFEVCDAWGAGVAEALENEPVRSDIPTLIMTGQYDPIVPPAFGEAIAETLEDATFLLFPGLSHGASGTECATDIMLAFLDDPSGTPDAGCLSDPAVTRFTLPAGPESVEMEPYSSEELGLVGLRPKGWKEPAPGTFGRRRSGTDGASLALLSLPFDTDEALARLTANFGLTEPPPVIDRIEANGLAWESYRTEAQGVDIDFALAQADGATLLVVLTSPATERDALHEGVFVPAVEALTTSTADD